MSVLISSDSTCDLSPELIEEYKIPITPLYIIVGEKDLKDGIEIFSEEIFKKTEETGKICSTAAVSVEDYRNFFEEKLKEYDEIVHFHISSDMSSCYQNALIAAEEFEGVYSIDSQNLSTGIGQLVLDACELAKEGKTGAEIKEILDEKKSLLDVSFVLDTLSYLRRGGRCSSVAELGANLLNLKPCIEVKNGTMGVGKKYRGNVEKCILKYVTDRLKDRDDIDTHRIFITHSGSYSEEALQEVYNTVASCQPFEHIYITQAAGTISCHCGPKCLGILYYHTR